MKTLSLVGLLATSFSSTAHAGSSIEPVNCGQILTREFDAAHQLHEYKIKMDPGGAVSLRVVPLGDTLAVSAAVYEPAGQEVTESRYLKEIRLSTGKLSGRGIHTLRIWNSEYHNDRGDGYGNSRVGVYTLEISCVLADGTKVDAGSEAGLVAAAVQQVAPGAPQNGGAGTGPDYGKYTDDVQKLQSTVGAAQQAVQVISGVVDIAKGLKFWGKKKGTQEAAAAAAPAYQKPEDMMAKGQQLAYAQPVETPAAFAPKSVAAPAEPPPVVDRQTFPLVGLGTLLQGEVTASSGVQGCRFQAMAGQGVDLKFERLTGNQGLMVTVFGPDQQPVFLSSVLASPKLATTLQLSAGEYAVEITTAGSVTGPARFSLQLSAISKK